MTKYHDRSGGQNWTHLYNDWAHLKSRHSIRFHEVKHNPIDQDLALAILNLYFDALDPKFDGLGQEIQKKSEWKAIVGDNSPGSIVQWVDDLVQVGWQLCSNT
ncbi:MAG: hypothetical protein HC936_14765 [Leptolyngbyaceae cyanobacterium SU_3_3]|nr:hypothetical protein [Leptolyngbyaceae cyanobacterium SU_3_3]